MSERFSANYVLRTLDDADRAAGIIAGEQSSGTFVSTPGEDEALKARSAARVEMLEEIEDAGGPALPGSAGNGPIRSWRLRLSWPLENIGPSIPNLIATVAGNLGELKQVAGLKITDLDLPPSFFGTYPGPAFGIEGTRRLSGVTKGPLIGTIIKPSVGLTPAGTAELVEELCAGGIDFIKDDELQADGPRCPFEERLAAVMDVIDRHADRTGRKVMYAANITGEIDEMQRRHDLVANRGGTCVMVSLNCVGPAGVTALRRASHLPIHAHRNGWGILGRAPDNGWSYPAWATLWRLAGVDHMHVNGLTNKFWEPDDSVIRSARHCLSPLHPDHPYTVMPVFSSGQTVLQAAPTFAQLGSADLIFCAGGGVVAHPAGVAAGVTSLRQAWEAAEAGVPLAEAASRSALLQQAVEKFS
ncbi:ribulose-bisphosphate carboxylase large subunit family protein [Paracoccus zhejiangensis]|uniref:Ribulose 1,5-bisphosphate carboxylase n=1 Tax=Paracoccus zhejiangensis TaxID=1077935 RepID=A0A2H5F166_9RHOB|nr:ribulose-bisphosphate carboxylase large subunit family protein [Paracoccus zhejiangensis]AUH65295.1 ribulose 1,5-bisphosphate carboxylase [Paracoccus zhejiangensis]